MRKNSIKNTRVNMEVFEKFNDVKEGDQVEAYRMVEIPR